MYIANTVLHVYTKLSMIDILHDLILLMQPHISPERGESSHRKHVI